MAACPDQATEEEIPLRRRFIRGGVITVLGVLSLAFGLTKPAVGLVGVGAVLIFVGVAMLAPAVARPMASVIGRPLARLLGISGRLGRENSMRSPRRTAQTSAALMVGLALVSAIAVFGASLSRSATSSVDNAISADLIVSTTNKNGNGNFSTAVPKAASSAPGVTASSTVYGDQFEVRGSLQSLLGLGTKNLSQTVILNMTAGSVRALAVGRAAHRHQHGQRRQPLGRRQGPGAVRARRGPPPCGSGGSTSRTRWPGSTSSATLSSSPTSRTRSPAPCCSRPTAAPGCSRRSKRRWRAYPNVQVQTRAQFEASQSAQVNQLLGLVYALLALAVLIALIGIVNTLMLSVFERTHEIGLLRAVGMRRRQIRAMIRSESVILAVFGAVIGIIVGTGLGIALVSALHSQGITDTVVPVSSLVVFLILAALLGLLAASWPARRAARLDVLAAIAAQ